MAFTKADQVRSVTEVFFILERNKWIIILIVALMLALTAYHNSGLVPIYSASARMIIDKQSEVSPLTGQKMGYESYLSETMTFNTHFELITSREVMERVVGLLDMEGRENASQTNAPRSSNPIAAFFARLKKNIAFLTDRNGAPPPPPLDPMTLRVNQVRGMVEIEPVEDTRLLNVITTNSDPQWAKAVANGVAQAYIDFNIDNRMTASQNTLKWLRKNLEDMKQNVEVAEEEFARYKEQVQLISFEDGQNTIGHKINEFNDAYIEARNRRLELDAKLKQVRRLSSLEGDLPQMGMLSNNPVISELYNDLVDTEVALAEQSKIFKSKHPKIIQLKSKVEDLQSKLKREVRKELKGLEVEYSVLAAKEKVIQNTISEYEKDAMSNSRKQLQHDIFKRNLEMNQNIYDSILSRLKEVDLLGKVDVSNVRIVEAATTPQAPIGPNKRRNLIVGLLLGLILGAAVAYLKEYLDRSLHTEEDVERFLEVPVLSTIPIGRSR